MVAVAFEVDITPAALEDVPLVKPLEGEFSVGKYKLNLEIQNSESEQTDKDTSSEYLISKTAIKESVKISDAKIDTEKYTSNELYRVEKNNNSVFFQAEYLSTQANHFTRANVATIVVAEGDDKSHVITILDYKLNDNGKPDRVQDMVKATAKRRATLIFKELASSI